MRGHNLWLQGEIKKISLNYHQISLLSRALVLWALEKLLASPWLMLGQASNALGRLKI